MTYQSSRRLNTRNQRPRNQPADRASYNLALELANIARQCADDRPQMHQQQQQQHIRAATRPQASAPPPRRAPGPLVAAGIDTHAGTPVMARAHHTRAHTGQPHMSPVANQYARMAATPPARATPPQRHTPQGSPTRLTQGQMAQMQQQQQWMQQQMQQQQGGR